MSRYLKHFTVVGDDPVQWSNDYQKWEEEEEAGENEAKQQDSEIKLEPTRSRVSFQDVMKKLFSSHRFQVRQSKPGPKGNEGEIWPKALVTIELMWDGAQEGVEAAQSLRALMVPTGTAVTS